MAVLHIVGIQLGVIAMAGASVLAFFLSMLKLLGAIFIFLNINLSAYQSYLDTFGIEKKPVVLMLLDIVDTSLLGAILLTFAFGLKSVFLAKRFEVFAFDIRDINELKEYLIGLVITLMGTRFLEIILRGNDEVDVLATGLGIAAVIAALSAYELVLKHHKPASEGPDEAPAETTDG